MIKRFSSRRERLDTSFINKRLSDAVSYDRIAGYFSSSMLEVAGEKIEAMKILNSLEPVRRGIYSGGVGYLDYAGGMDLNMVIRSLIIEGDQISYHAGGGVVADSSPSAEYQESLDKNHHKRRKSDF